MPGDSNHYNGNSMYRSLNRASVIRDEQGRTLRISSTPDSSPLKLLLDANTTISLKVLAEYNLYIEAHDSAFPVLVLDGIVLFLTACFGELMYMDTFACGILDFTWTLIENCTLRRYGGDSFLAPFTGCSHKS